MFVHEMRKVMTSVQSFAVVKEDFVVKKAVNDTDTAVYHFILKRIL